VIVATACLLCESIPEPRRIEPTTSKFGVSSRRDGA
jgi:hypothetical protein